MREEYLQHGEILPKIFPPGPKNPMGLYALYIGKHYAIHGTNSNFGIGLRTTRGCVRLRAKDIKYLFNLVPIGTKVQFINEPIKITTENNGTQYLEVHQPLSYNKNMQTYHAKAIMSTYLKKYPCLLSNNKHYPNINYKIVKQALQEKTGIPINITYNQQLNTN